jgi:hypothetical protein
MALCGKHLKSQPYDLTRGSEFLPRAYFRDNFGYRRREGDETGRVVEAAGAAVIGVDRAGLVLTL